MTREDQVEKILDELEEEFAKVNMPINDKLTLFAKVSNTIYKCVEQEPCEDAISRQAVIDIIEDVCPIYGNDYRYILRDKVNELPPVTAEKVGQWINGKCNKCGTHAPYWAMASTYYCSEYCPKCGAKMEVE